MLQQFTLALSFCLLATTASAQTLFKWTDENGKTVYSDQPPPQSAKRVEEKRQGTSVIENNQLPFGTLEAQRKNPVILYTSDCGPPCEQALALLNKRGIPHSVVRPQTVAEVEAFKKLTGATKVPVISIGDKLNNGFAESEWQEALTKAGYPKAAPFKGPVAKNEAKPAPSSTITDADHPMAKQLSAVFGLHVNAAKKGDVRGFTETLDTDTKAKLQKWDIDALKKLGAATCDPALAQFGQAEVRYGVARIAFVQRISGKDVACAVKLVDEAGRWKVALTVTEEAAAGGEIRALVDKAVNDPRVKI